MGRRLLVAYLSLALVVLLALEIPLAIFYERSERRELSLRLERDAVRIASVVSDSLQASRPLTSEQVATYLTRAFRAKDGRVVVVDQTGESVTDTGEPGAAPRSFASRPEIQTALIGAVATGSRFSNTLDAELIYVAVPVRTAGTVAGAVRITYPESDLRARILRYWLMLIAVAAIVLAAATAVGLRFVRQIARPLARLERAAGEAGRGDLNVRAPVDGPPEVRSLASSFNDMVGRLQELMRSQQKFVADASHQLRTPLAALRLRLEAARPGSTPDDVEGALKEVERLARLVAGLLSLARADAAEAPPGLADVALIASERCEAWTAFAAEEGATIHAILPDSLPARVTPDRLSQVLDNLIENALEATPAGSTITIAGAVEDGQVVLRVRDQGLGMSVADRSRAFDRFWRSRSDATGSGLGLAIVRRLVIADGGSVELGDAPRGGLEVTIHLRPSTPGATSRER